MKLLKRMPTPLTGLLLVVGLLIVAWVLLRSGHSSAPGKPSSPPLPALNGFPFERLEIDSVGGDIKLVGDLDGDGKPDLVLGGKPGERLNWYRAPDWHKTVIATPHNEYTTDGALGDVDGDGDLDIVVADGKVGDNLMYFENPRPAGDPADAAAWRSHPIGAIGDWCKDVYLADFDGDGTLDVATRRAAEAMIFFQERDGGWHRMALEGITVGHEGMTSGDINGDGLEDLVLQGVWVANPGGQAARDPTAWREHQIGTADRNFKALVVDLDQNGQMDVLFSSSEGTADVTWWTPGKGGPTGQWQAHILVPQLNRAHTLQAGDMDLDGDLDVVIGQMHTSVAKELFILENLDGRFARWQKHHLDSTGIHNGVVADLDGDGDLDIYGANWTGNPPLRVWMNRLEARGPLDRWCHLPITSSHARTFGLTFADMNRDGRLDIVSGGFWYANPGGNLEGGWPQTRLPEGMHALLTLDVDHDGDTDLIAQKDEGVLAIYWLEMPDGGVGSWQARRVGEVPRASHALGAQGYRVGQLEAGGPPEVAISSGEGIWYFRVPVTPAEGPWHRVQVSSAPSDEGFAFGDMDGDGDLDVAATTGEAKGVVWYENPADGSSSWAAHPVGRFTEALFPDRTEVADLNRDGRLDIVVTEENGKGSDAETFWWAQPAAGSAAAWTRHLVTRQGSSNSLDVADMDGDGDLDLIIGEHRGAKRLAIWVNDGAGHFEAHEVSRGWESHLGARAVDLDGDGDLDLVSIAWDAPGVIHLWRNDRPGG